MTALINPPLLNAVWFCGEAQIRVLIAHGSNVNQRTAPGPPLMKAIEVRNSNKARLLLHAGAETTNFEELIRPIAGARDI